MDEALMNKWVSEVWTRRPGGLRNVRSLLVFVSMRTDLVESVKQQLLDRRNTVIPGGCTKLLQPLDVSLNKPFKDNLKYEWESWMQVDEEHSVTATGRMRAATPGLLCRWVAGLSDDPSRRRSRRLNLKALGC
jgi:hypothetical protein